jgi:hypothetical protein
LNPPAVSQITGVPAVMLEFRGVLDEMKTVLPCRRNAPTNRQSQALPGPRK